MSELFWLSEAQMERLRPFFPRPRGQPRVDDRCPKKTRPAAFIGSVWAVSAALTRPRERAAAKPRSSSALRDRQSDTRVQQATWCCQSKRPW